MRKLKFIKIWLSIGWFLTGMVVYLSLIPSLPETPGFHGADKCIHFLTYAFLMFWFGLCYKQRSRTLLTGAGLIALGIILEWIQGKTGYREQSFFDGVANSLGVCFGWFLSGTRFSLALVYVERWLGLSKDFI